MAEGLADRGLVVGTSARHTMHPQRSAMKEVAHPSEQCVNELSRRVDIEADKVNDDIRLERGDPISERPL
jgi:hypothetical protein